MSKRLCWLMALAGALWCAPVVAQEDDPDEPPASDPQPEEQAPPETPPAPAGDPAKEAPPAETGAAPAAESEPPLAPSRGGVSWTTLAARVPRDGALIQVELGFSGLPRVAYHHSLGAISIGGLVAFDYARFAPKIAFDSSLVLAVPVRYGVAIGESLELGLRGDTGVVLPFSGGVGVLFDLQANAGFIVDQRFIVGGGIDMPIIVGSIGGTTTLSWPFLFGPVFEYHVAPPLALTVDAKFGPYFNTGTSVLFGMRVMAGVGYRI
jgi:hypothetical protein